MYYENSLNEKKYVAAVQVYKTTLLYFYLLLKNYASLVHNYRSILDGSSWQQNIFISSKKHNLLFIFTWNMRSQALYMQLFGYRTLVF